MAKPNQRSAAHLFNNPILSDVTIRQIYKGKVREYHAHKAILCSDSSYFLKAFTGNFRESSENVMEIHDDDPDQFEFLLKFYYTHDYGDVALDNMADGDIEKRLLLPISIHALADKYDIQCICNAIVDDLRAFVDEIEGSFLRKMLKAHYATVPAAGGPLGKFLTTHLLGNERSFMDTTEYNQMIVSITVFGADMALAHKRNIINMSCNRCCGDFIMRRDIVKTSVHCPYCKSDMTSAVET